MERRHPNPQSLHRAMADELREYGIPCNTHTYQHPPRIRIAATHEVQPAEPAVSDKPKRRWFQFSLGMLMAVITVLAVLLGIPWQLVARPAESQRTVVQRVRELGGRVRYFPTVEESWPILQLRKLLSEDYFDAVEEVDLDDTKASDADIPEICRLQRLHKLKLARTQVTDAGLVQLRGITELKLLYLHGTSVTSDGIVNLQDALPKCAIHRYSFMDESKLEQ